MPIKKDKIDAVPGLREKLEKQGKKKDDEKEEKPRGGSSSTKKDTSKSTSKTTSSKAPKVKQSAIDAVPGLREKVETKAKEPVVQTPEPTTKRRTMQDIYADLDKSRNRLTGAEQNLDRFAERYGISKENAWEDLATKYGATKGEDGTYLFQDEDSLTQFNRVSAALSGLYDTYTNEYNAYSGLYDEMSNFRTADSVGFEISALEDEKSELLRQRAVEMDVYRVSGDATKLVDIQNKIKVIDDKLEPLLAEQEELKALERQDLIDSGEYHDANFWDLTGRSVAKGYLQARQGQETYKAMKGWDNKKAEFDEKLAQEKYQFLPDGKLEEFLSGGAELAGQISRQYTDPRALLYALESGGLAMLAGNAGPQAIVPEEVVSVPTAIAAGFQIGGAQANYEIEAGHAYNEMIDMGISPKTASIVAEFVGGGNALLEMVQMDDLLKSFKALKSSAATQNAAKMIGEYLENRGVHVLTETGQEVAQEAVTMLGGEVASRIDKGESAYTWDETLERLGDTAVSSAGSFAVMGIPGDVVNITSQAYKGKKYADLGEKYEYEGAADEIIASGLEASEETDAHKIAVELQQKQARGETITNEEIGRAVEANARAIAAEERIAEANAEPQETIEDAAREVADMETKAAQEALKWAESVPYNAMSDNNVTRLNALAVKSSAEELSGYGKAGAKAFYSILENSDMEPGMVRKEFQSAYEAGMTNLPREMAQLGSAIQEKAYTAGQLDSILSMRKKKTVTIFGKENGFIENDVSKALSKQEVSTFHAMGKSLGTKIMMEEQVYGGRANGSYKDGVIRIAKDAANPYVVVAKHEITHRMQELAPAEYTKYRNYAVQIMSAARNMTGTTLVEAYQDRAAEAGVALSTEQAMDEIAADFTEKILTDKKSLHDFVNSAKESVENRTRVQKFFDAVREFINKIKRVFNGDKAKMDKAARDQFGATVEQLENAERLWKEAYRAAEKNVSEAVSESTEAKTTRDGKLFRTVEADGTIILETSVGNPVAMMTEDGSAQFSLKTYEAFGRAELKRWLTLKESKGQVTKEEAKDIIRQLDEYYDLCQKFTDKYAPFGAWSNAEVVRDNKGKPVFSVVKANGEYAMNLDFSLVCKKRRTLDAVFMEMIRRGIMDDISLEEADIAKVNEIIRENGFETACALCFVDSKRYRQGKVADTFVTQYNDIVRQLIPAGGGVKAHHFDFVGSGVYKDSGTGLHTLSDAELQEGIEKLKQIMRENGKQTVAHKIAKHLLNTPKDRKLMSRSDFMNTDGFGAVKLKNPAVLKLYNSSKGAGGPKAAFSDVQYLGEILQKNNFTPARAYAVGGVRIQSFSDYIPRLVFDYLQMVGDLSAKKLPAHAYTKEAIFVKQFGLTGIKMNMSLVPAVAEDGVAAGLDKNGDYLWYDGQSFGSDVKVKGSGKTGFDLAVQIQNAPGYSKNCGTVAVGVSREHILKMLDDEDIRMIIPYHKSSLNHIVAVMNNIDKYTDYTKVQNTRMTVVDENGNQVLKKISGKDFNFNEALRRTGDAKAAAAEYLAWCKEKGYTPKFDEFAKHDNYYKVLEDFATYDNGVAAPQGAVTMTFPKAGDAFGSMAELIEQGLEEDAILEADREKSVPKIVDQVEKALKKKDSAQYSLKGAALDRAYREAVESGDYLEAKRMYDEARKNAGYTEKVYHGTDEEFYAFDTSPTGVAAQAKTAHGWAAEYTPGAIFLAPTRRMASGYGDRVMDMYLNTDGMKVFEHKDMGVYEAFMQFHTKDVDKYPVIKIVGADDTFYVTRGNTRVKSAEPIIYDDNGDLIPLSKRFNTSKSDIRYSLKITEASARRALYDVLDHADAGHDNLVLLGDMPQYIQDISGIFGDIYLFRNHAYENMVSEEQAEADGRLAATEKGRRNQHFHNMGEDLMVKSILALEEPLVTIADQGTYGNPAMSMVLPVFDEQNNPIHAVVGFYADEPINGTYKKRPHIAVTFYGHPYEFESDSGHKTIVDVVSEAIEGGKVLDFDRKKLRADLPVIAQDTTLGNVTASALKQNVAQFRKNVKQFKGKNKIFYSLKDSNVAKEESSTHNGKYTVAIAFSSEQVKNVTNESPTSNPDIRFSLKGQSELMKQNAKLKETVEGLREQFKTTRFAKVDKKSLEAFTKQLLKDYSSGADITETRDALDALYTYLANGEDGMAPSWNEAYKRAYETAVSILEASGVLDDEMYQTYKDLRTRLKNRAISISSEYDHDLGGYESINDFRKANFGRLKISKDGTPVDIVYSELATVYPELFDEYTYTNQADQAVHIAEVLESLQPVEVNPYSYNMREHATWLANDIMERFFELPQAKPTFADKAEQRLTKQVIKDTKKLEKLRTEKNERIRQLIEANREKVKTAQEKERAKRQEAVKKVKEHYKEKESKASASRKTRELRAKVVRHAEQMGKRLLSGTDKVNVPEVLKPAVAELLSCINLESNYTYDPETGSYKKYDDGLPTRRTEAFREIKKQYEAIAANNDIGMVISPDLLGVPAEGIKSMLDIVAGYKDIRLVDMNLEQLQTVYDVIRVVEHSILMAGKTLSKMRWQTIDSAADAFMADTMTRKTKRSLTEKHKMLDIETPYTFFSHFGEAGHGFYRMLRDAQDREQVMQDELMEKLAEVVSLEKRQKAEKDVVEFTTLRGDKLTLSKAHIMNIYLLNNRKQAKGHLLGGGIVQPKVGKIRKGTEAVLLTEMDLANLFTNLTKEERAIADGLQKLTLRLAEWGNEASMTVYGIKKFNDPDYWTIRSSDIGFNQTIEQGPNKARSIANMGSAKSVIPEARNPLDIDSVFEVFDRHASDMLCYSAWLAPMEDANRLFNYKFRDENWIPTGKTMKGIINRASGEGSTQYWMRLMEDIQNGLSAPADTATEHDVMKAIGNVKKASVSGNIRVVIQQPTAYARAMAVLDVDAALAGVVKGTAIKPSLDGWAKAVKYAPIAARKAAGGYEVSSNPKQLAELLYQPESALGKMKQGAKEAPLWAAATADKVTWGAIWNACEWQVAKDNKNIKKGTDEFYEAVKVLFTEVIDQTQVVDGVLQRSQAMRSGSSFVKQMTAFTGEPTQGANMVVRAYDQLRYETDSKKRGKAIKKLSRAVSVYTFTAVLNAFAQSLVDGIRDDDDEKDYWEKVWSAFHGINGNEETWWDYARNVVLASNVGNNMNPMSWLPVWKDVLSVVQGYSVERMDAASMGDFFDSVSMVVKTLGGDGKYTTGYAALKALVAGGKLLGSSSYNILRDVEGVIRTFQVETDDYMARYNTLKMMTKPANNMTAYAKLLYKAYENDPESYKKMYSDLLKSGVEADTIRSKMESLMKKSQGVNSVSDLEQRFLPPAQQTEYDRMLNSIQRSGVWKQANGAQRDKVEDKVYDMVMDKTNEATMSKIDDGAKYGIDETDYLLYQLALSVVDKPSENGKYGSYTVAERADAITDTGLSDKEMAYLWYSSQTGDEEKWSDEVFDALDRGIDIETYIDFKAFESVTKADKNAAGKTISGSKKAKIRNYLNENAVDMDTFDFIFYEVMGYKD